MTTATALPPPKTDHETRHGTHLAPMYKVLLHNDDKTPFDFVERDVCRGIFHLDGDDARRITLEVHHGGIGLVGVYPLEQAEFKTDQTRSLARGRGYPLRVTFEPA